MSTHGRLRSRRLIRSQLFGDGDTQHLALEERVEIAGLELGQEIGHGAYSVVYRARRGSQPCAVKIARRSSAPRWFRREAAALARVQHPGVPKVLDVGEASGRPYLVLELFEGKTLGDRLGEGPLNLEETIDLAIELAEIAASVHARGLVHRDIKPRNIVLADDGSVRLVDFGLVTQLHPILGLASASGTRRYAAPEQLWFPHLADARSDIYSLGRVVEACLVTDVSQRPPFDAFLRHACAAEPADRYGSMKDVLRALRAMRAGASVPQPRRRLSAEDDSTPLAGRENELQSLCSAYEQLLLGNGGVLIVEGPAGIGKSRLLREFTRISERSPGPLVLRSRAHAGVPLQAVRDLVDAFLDPEADDIEERNRQIIRAVPNTNASLLARLSCRFEKVRGAAGHEQGQRECEAFLEAAAELFASLARSRNGLVACVDDLHQLDPLSREILVRVALRTATTPILFVGTARPTGSLTLQRFATTLAPGQLKRIPLPPLSEHAVGNVLAGYLNEAALAPSLVARIAAIAEGTPLAALEMTGTLIDSGALWPQWGSWGFDPERARAIPLSPGAVALIERRIAQLPDTTVEILQAVAVADLLFDVGRTASMFAVREEDVRFALAESRNAGLVDIVDDRPRFVHEAIRESVLGNLTQEAGTSLHQRIAETWDDGTQSGTAAVFAIARHYGHGQKERKPRQAYRAAHEAAILAANQLDHEDAVEFFQIGAETARLGGWSLEPIYLRAWAESQISVGDLDGSLESLQAALVESRGIDRVEILARQAWVHDLRADASLGWSTLERAFAELGDVMPTESPVALAGTLFDTLQQWIQRGDGSETNEARRRRQRLLCDLHHQNARLGLVYDRPLRVLASTRALLSIGRTLGPSPTIAKSRAIYGMFMVVLKRQRAGVQAIAEARDMALQLQHSGSLADVSQAEFVATSWTGDFPRALVVAKRCLDTYGHWLNVTDFCLVAASARIIELFRGRPAEALEWLDRGLNRVRRHGRVPAVYPQVLACARRAELVLLGREENDEFAIEIDPTSRGLFKLANWGPRAVVAAETSDAELEVLISEFQREQYAPARVHPVVLEYYIVVAHARANQCLALAPSRVRDKESALARLDAALVDLRRATKHNLARAHLRSLEGFRAMLAGDHPRARQRLAVAQELAEQEIAPWVLYTVARIEAHLLRSEGREASAIDRAKVAALLAEEHGAVHRLRRVREEFGLRLVTPRQGTDPNRDEDSSSTGPHQLRVLLSAVTSAHLKRSLEEQSVDALDELIAATGARRGLLRFDSPQGTSISIGRTSDGAAWTDRNPTRVALINRMAEGPWTTPSPARVPLMRPRTLAVPLGLHERIVGALHLERDSDDPPFSSDEAGTFATLAPQVPVTLELARSMSEREKVESKLRQAHRMEAVGQLSSGIAYDFNNTLTAINAAVDDIERSEQLDEARRNSLSIIHDSIRRASDLTRQLLAFSRRQMLEISVVDVSDVLREVVPLIQRMLGRQFEVRLHGAGNEPRRARTDRSPLTQAIVNLAINARDAMAGGGTIDIRVSIVHLGAEWRERGAQREGAHVAIEIADTGVGMPPEVLERVFEPFFTTKALGSGNGLGLASVYGFVKQCDGHIEARSQESRGSVFTMFLPSSDHAVAVPHLPIEIPPASQVLESSAHFGSGVILLIENERLVRTALTSALEREGYWVLTARDAFEAIDIVRAGGPVDLVIANAAAVSSPGPDLPRELLAAGLQIPLLFVTGSSPAERRSLGEGVEILQKPFEHSDLVARVRSLLR